MEATQIRMIIEAFSIQPNYFCVGDKMNNKKIIDCIKFEIRPNHEDVYVGYSENGEKLFEYIVKSVNVQYI